MTAFKTISILETIAKIITKSYSKCPGFKLQNRYTTITSKKFCIIGQYPGNYMLAISQYNLDTCGEKNSVKPSMRCWDINELR